MGLIVSAPASTEPPNQLRPKDAAHASPEMTHKFHWTVLELAAMQPLRARAGMGKQLSVRDLAMAPAIAKV